MPLSDIAKKIQKREIKTIPYTPPSQDKVVFGIPKSDPNITPSLRGTMTSTPQTTQPKVDIKVPEVKQVETPDIKLANVATVALDRERGVSISAGLGEDKAVAPGRKLPLIGSILWGRGSNKLYQQDTIAGAVEKEGVVGFFFEGWKRFSNPTREQVGDKVYESYDKFVQEGIEEDRALDAAIQNVVNQTYGSAINIEDFKKLPETELTEEEKDLVFWINARDDLFAVLDAPVFVGSTKIVKEGVEELVERVAPLRDIMIKRLEKPTAISGGKDILMASDDIERYLEFLKDTPDVSINQLNEGLELLRVSGREFEDIASELVTVTQDIAKQPAKYIKDPKIGQFRGSVTQTKESTLDDFLKEIDTKATVDEVVEPITIYHGGTADSVKLIQSGDFDALIDPAIKESSTGGNRLGVSASTNREIATDFAYGVGGNKDTVAILELKPGSKVLNVTKELDEFTEDQFREIAKKYDAVRDVNNVGGENEIRILNNKALAQFDEKQEVVFQDAIQAIKDGESFDDFADGVITRGDVDSIEKVQTIWDKALKQQVVETPVQAFAGGVVGIEEDEEGNIQIDPTKAFLGMAAAGFLGLNFNKFKGRNQSRNMAAQGETSSRLDQRVLQEGIDQSIKKGEANLASSNLSDSLTEAYAKEAGESIVDIEKALNPATMKPRKVSPEDMTRFQKLREVIDNKWTEAVQWFQDDMVKVRNLVNNPNVKVTDDTDPWIAETLFHGRIGSRLETAKQQFVAIDKDIIRTAQVNGVPEQDMTTLVNKFLHSRHAPERNARLGDGAAGMTNAEAQAMQVEIEALPYGKEVARIAEQVQEMNNQTLDVLLEAQVIDKEAYDAMRSAYTNHVPLQRVLKEDEDIVQALTGRGFDVKSTGIKRAKGSEREVADIMTNVVTNYEQALIRAEKNRVDLTTLAFARDNKELGLFEEIKPKAIGKAFDRPAGQVPAEFTDRPMPEALASTAGNLREQIEDAWGRIYGEFDFAEAGSRRSVVFEKDGLIDRIESKRSTFPSWVPKELRSKELFNKVLDLHSAGKTPPKNAVQQRQLLDVMEDQVMKYLSLDAQDELALSYLARESEILASVYDKVKGARGRVLYEQITDPRVLTLRENGKPVFLKINNEDLATALKGVSRHQVPSYMRGIQAFTRFYSGLQTRFNPEFAFPNKIRDLQEATVYAGSRGELGFSGGIRGALDVKSYKDVVDNIMGRDTEGAKLYQQMIDDGGTTGGMSLSTREAVELDIAEIRTLNRSNPRAAAEKIIRSIDNFNQIFEDSTRLALYKQALNNGVSRKRAALIAKESTINFNKLGRGGPIVNSLWMFSNASIQGTTKMMRAMKNPKVAAAVSSSVFAGVYATGEWNDNIDPDWRDKVTKWDRTNSLVLVLPSSQEGEQFNYVSIPVGWGIKPIKVGADYLYDASVGKGVTSEEAFGGIVASAINAYNPVGGTDILSGITPTIADIPSEIYRNQSWHGGKIMPDWDMRKDHLRYYPSLVDNTTGQMAVDVSNGLTGVGIEVSPASIYYAYEGYIGGAGRTVTDTVNTLISAGRGEMPNPNDIPIWSRFVKQRDVDEIGAGSDEHERVKQIQIEEDSERAILNFEAESAIRRLQSVDQEEAATLFDNIAERDPELAEKINKILDEQELGLTYTERNLKGLTVESRANYIYDKLESLDSDEERAELWDEYTEKKILTKSVAERVNAIYDGTDGEDKRPRYDDGQTTTQKSFIDNIKTYAEAIGTDPVTAFNRIFTGQKIRRIDGGAIIVERMPFEDSQKVREARGATEEMRLDHTLPLQLGGSNDGDNLKLVPYADWERYTAVENMLGDALRDEKVNSKDAKQLILDFKSGKLTSQQVKDAIDNQ